jgi:hypothetical protein
MQEVHEDGCRAIVEWFMLSTPVKLLAEAMVDALHFHQVRRLQAIPLQLC